MARRRTHPNKARVGKLKVPVPPGAMPQDVSMAPGQEARLQRFLNRGMHDRNGNLAVNNALFRNLGRISWMRMIVGKRIAQAMPFCHEPRFRGDKGVTVRLKREQEMTAQLEARRREILTIVLNGSLERERPADKCPGPWDGRYRTRADVLSLAVAKILSDSLVMDSAGILIELGRDPIRYPVAWWKAQDGARIRKADPIAFTDSYRDDVKYPEWVILDRDESYKWVLAWNEFAPFLRNPDTSEEGQGLGNPELASALEIITALVTAYKYNVGNFTEWKLPMGFMEIADCDDNVLEEFISDLEMQVGGVAGYWSAVPYISKPQGFEGKDFVRWVDLAQRPSDIQFRDLMMLSLNKLTGLFGMSAEELGFPSFDSGKATLNDGSPAAILENSRDTGFVPLMYQLERFLSSSIVEKFDDGIWELAFVGLDDTDEKSANEARQTRLNMGLTSIEQEQTEADFPVRRPPLDTILWATVHGELLRQAPQLRKDNELLHHMTETLYLAKGGTFFTGTQFGMSMQDQQAYYQEIMRKQQSDDARQEQEQVDPWAAYGVQHPDDRIQQRIDGGAPDDEEQGGGEDDDQGGEQDVQKSLTAPRHRVFEIFYNQDGKRSQRNVA